MTITLDLTPDIERVYSRKLRRRAFRSASTFRRSLPAKLSVSRILQARVRNSWISALGFAGCCLPRKWTHSLLEIVRQAVLLTSDERILARYQCPFRNGAHPARAEAEQAPARPEMGRNRSCRRPLFGGPQKVAARLGEPKIESLYLSVVSCGEQGDRGAYTWKKKSELEAWYGEDLLTQFSGRILSLTLVIAERWVALEAQRQRIGHLIQVPGAQIAATAIERGLTLVTRNIRAEQAHGAPRKWEGTFAPASVVRRFFSRLEGLGVSVINPWGA